MKSRVRATIQAVTSHVEADAVMLDLMEGKHLYRRGARRAHQVPAVEWFRVTSPNRENTQRVLIQFDVYGRTYDEASAIEAQLCKLLDHDNPAVIGGLRMVGQYDDGRDHPDDSDEDEVRTSVDFAFEIAKEH